MKKRLMAILLIALAAAGIFAIGKSGMPVKEKEQSEDSSLFSNHNKDSIYLWYTDDALTTYLSSAAVAYNETHDARIVPVLESGLDYVETINRNSVESNVPDLYVISNDALEKGVEVEREGLGTYKEFEDNILPVLQYVLLRILLGNLSNHQHISLFFPA